MSLEENGYPRQVSPPRLLPGCGSFTTSRPRTWMDLPLLSDLGRVDGWIALRQA